MTTTTAPKFKGTAVEFADGITRVLPPLTLRALAGLQDRLMNWRGGADAASVALVTDTVFASLSRNYPDLKVDELQDMLDVSNMVPAMNAVMGVSGLERRASGEAQAAVTAAG